MAKSKVNRRTRFQVAFYWTLRVVTRPLGALFLRLRVKGREHYPGAGGALICANHQSHFDPVLIGLTCDRRMNYVARRSLFSFAPFRWIIETLDAIPIEREGIGLSGVKETLRRLKRGEMVLIFPEGTRTRDGKIGDFRPGFCTLARRGNVPIIPIGFDGVFDAWPRSQPLPGWAPTCVCIGDPITPQEFDAWDDDELMQVVRQRMIECFENASRTVNDRQPFGSKRRSTSSLTASSMNATTESPG